MMSKKEKEILEELKKKLIATKNVTADDFFSEDDKCRTQNCIYYLRSFNKNVLHCNNNKHYRTFKEGRGRELGINSWGLVPMASLRSSAALTWNIFGDEDTCHLKKEWNISSGDYVLMYEWQSETINGHNASLDAYLYNNNCHLFVEMKMLEPLTRKHRFESIDKYLKPNACPPEFQNAIIKFQEKEPQFFDAFQMLKHLLAIYNHFKKMKYHGRQKVVLLNCHWKPSEAYIGNHTYSNRTISLDATYEEFQNTANRFVAMLDGEINFKSLFNDINVDLELAACDHSKLISILGKKGDTYLERYEI